MIAGKVQNPRALAEERIGAYLASCVARAGGTELEQSIAHVIGSLFGHGPAVFVSTEHIQQRCADRGVRPGRWWTSRVGYGSVTRVLEILRSTSVTWTKAHVKRWHGPLSPDPTTWPRLRPRRNAAGDWRCPARWLRLVGFAAQLVAFANLDVGAAAGAAREADRIEPDPYCSSVAVLPGVVQPPQVTSRPVLRAEIVSSDAERDGRWSRDVVTRAASWRPPDDG